MSLPSWGPRPASKSKPAAEELETLWAGLEGRDGARAYRAIQQLAAALQAVPFLKERLRSKAAGPDPKRVAKLIADLDNDDFGLREKATAELETLGDRAEAALRQALDKNPSAEMRNRLAELLKKLERDGKEPRPSAELVQLRVVEALELSGTKQAQELLDELARGDADSLLSREAKASLERLARRLPRAR
jgi:hypothetical protein